MKKCALCGKSFNNDEAEYGLSCLKRLCSSMDIEDIKGYKDEKKLNKKVCKVLGKGNLPNEQSKLLTNRYCTLKLLDKVKLKEYDKYRTSVENDIHKIGIITSSEELKSFKKITLKQANEVNKHYKKYKNIFQKIKDGDYDAQQYITSGLIRFAFSRYYAKKPYLSDMIQKLQLYTLKYVGEIYLIANNYDFAIECLEHSFQKDPKDIKITDGTVVDEIKKETVFQATINKFINENKHKKTFYQEENIEFNDGDLFNALHGVTLKVSGVKENNKWKLDITITDPYDFTELTKLQDYMGKEHKINKIPAAIGNNLALIATSCNVVHKYNITIKFNMEV